jgi:pimeloyl-ACP methyl ester carboxylesterase
MLNFVTRELATHYFLLTFLSILGILQLVAARHRLIGLSLWESRNPALGYLLGAALTAGAFAWFFATTPEVFVPGLAGSELAILFGAAGICALAFTLIVSSALHRFQHRERSELRGGGRLRHEAVSLQQLRGMLYLPEDAASLKDKPMAAICVLPAPSEETLSPYPIVANLVKEGFIILAIDWGPEREIRYPAVLGLLPSAVAYLTRRDDVNAERIGVLGIDLGGDLAIRSAGTDQQIAAVLALAPFLSQLNTKPGLSILREMSYLETIRWSSFRKRGNLVAELAVLDSISALSSRPLLLVYGDRDGIVPVERAYTTLGEEMAQGRLRSLPGEGHLSLPHSPAISTWVAHWFKENL